MDRIIAELDAEIARLQQAKAILVSIPVEAASKPRNAKRKLSAAARARISAAQKARWARAKAK